MIHWEFFYWFPFKTKKKNYPGGNTWLFAYTQCNKQKVKIQFFEIFSMFCCCPTKFCTFLLNHNTLGNTTKYDFTRVFLKQLFFFSFAHKYLQCFTRKIRFSLFCWSVGVTRNFSLRQHN